MARLTVLLVIVAFTMACATWLLWMGAYLGRLGDKSEQPLILLMLGTPPVAFIGLILAIKNAGHLPHYARRLQLVAVISFIASAIAILPFFFIM